MSNKRIPILLTSSVIAYDQGVTLKNTDERIRLAVQSIHEWLKVDPTLSIVLCDGSSFDFSEVVACQFPNAVIECLPFENDQAKVRQYGRGYGEGEIVRYALNHSSLIDEAGAFAKCSSKLWVENFAACSMGWNGNFLCKGVFKDVFSPIRETKLSYIDTRFYISSKSFYQDHFADAHLMIGEAPGFGLEDSFLKVVLKKDLNNIMFDVAPVICGVGGGIGTYYKNTLARRLKEDFRLHLVKGNRKFHKLFTCAT